MSDWNTSKIPFPTESQFKNVKWSHKFPQVHLINEEGKALVCNDARVAFRELGLNAEGLSTTSIRTTLGIPHRSSDSNNNYVETALAEAKKNPKLISQLLSQIDNHPPKPVQKQPATTLQQSQVALVSWVWNIREQIKKATAAGNRTKRLATTRMIQSGITLLKAGINIEQVKARLLIGWSTDEVQKLAGGLSTKAKFGRITEEGELLVRAGFKNIFFVGPSGCGKSTLVEKIATKLGVQYSGIPCSEELPTAALYGKKFADGTYEATSFVEIYENGGVFLLDEIFKLSGGVSVALNMALANNKFYNPSAARWMTRHKDCIIVGASNSFGTGSAIYTTDQQQDPAYLDRFIGGAVEVDYDKEYEMSLALDER